jgi:hypothetical protein
VKALRIVLLSITSRRIVPLPDPVFTFTVYMLADPTTSVMDAPVTPVVNGTKSSSSTPVTSSEKVTVKFTELDTL